eukprot:4941912-Pyramimonas_sp.AAC.1
MALLLHSATVLQGDLKRVLVINKGLTSAVVRAAEENMAGAIQSLLDFRNAYQEEVRGAMLKPEERKPTCVDRRFPRPRCGDFPTRAGDGDFPPCW